MEFKNIKESVRESLEENFIKNKALVEREKNLINTIISSFCKNSEYTYDEYCQKRMEYELEACEKGFDIDLNKEMNISIQERLKIENTALIKSLENSEIEYGQLIMNELINYQLNKLQDIDRRIYYQISKHSTINLLKNKISKEVWALKSDYFIDICESRANSHSIAASIANRSTHEQGIRLSLL